MNKSHFTDFIENPSKVRENDADILAELARNYPYSSLIHTLLAKAHAGGPQEKQSLASAALHIPDRRVLKEVMENSLQQPVVEEAPPVPQQTSPLLSPEAVSPATVNPQEEESSLSFSVAPLEETSGEVEQAPQSDVLEELQENLRRLREQRERFQNGESEKKPETEGDTTLSPAESEAEELKKIPVQQLPERLQEIVQSRAVQEIKDPKRVEQINLIDSFIEKSAGIARKYRSLTDEPETQSDLTDNYHFTPQDLVTENLAKIMVRQGKPEKAIDIYEKLVLKFPQKKAYFATCIEKLKTPNK